MTQSTFPPGLTPDDLVRERILEGAVRFVSTADNALLQAALLLQTEDALLPILNALAVAREFHIADADDAERGGMEPAGVRQIRRAAANCQVVRSNLLSHLGITEE